NYSRISISENNFRSNSFFAHFLYFDNLYSGKELQDDKLVFGWSNFSGNGRAMRLQSAKLKDNNLELYAEEAAAPLADGVMDSLDITKDASITNTATGNTIQTRKNFNETAFFLPDLHTDADGNIEFSFTIPES